MEDKRYNSINEVLDQIKKAYGHLFKQYDVNNRLLNDKNKGRLGQIVEEGILGYGINSNPKPDLENLGVEIKTSGLIKTKKGYSAKERLTIDSLNYCDIISFSFENSPVWEKMQKMLIVLYIYEKGITYGDMKIVDSFYNQFPKEDLFIIKDDYNKIVKKIKDGQANNISEGDTMYLGACTAGKGDLIKQPYSDIKAKQRKFCLKQSYFSNLVKTYLNKSKYEHIFPTVDLSNLSFGELVVNELSKFYGISEEEIQNKFKIISKSKSRYNIYIARMLKIKGNINETNEFLKANIKIKTIRIGSNGKIKESMSFPQIDFCELVKQDFEESDVRDMFENQKFLFCVYKEKNGKVYFDNVFFWNMPENIIDEHVRRVFERTKEVLLSGNIVKVIKYNRDGKPIRINNFPGKSFDDYVHLRPHGLNANDTIPLPVPDKLTGATCYTKQCFWLNNSYVLEIIKNNKIRS